jgi:transposase-like protein
MSQTPATLRWTGIVRQHERSGLTIREFAEAHAVNPNTLAWWRTRLGVARRRTTFVEVTVEELEEPVVDVVLDRYDARVAVDRDTDLELLRDILAALC